ncbi:MAG: ABC transporter permease [candidate division KSB1 bacterium]|nr:ABC transporter permease [candidate division KSB1 bacterium]
MVVSEYFSVAFATIRANKLRSFLTLLGVVIGVMTIIAMQSLVEGLKRNVAEQLQILGNNVFQVQKYPPIQLGGESWRKYRNRKNLTVEEAEAIREKATAVRAVCSKAFHGGATIRFEERKTLPTVVVVGTTPEYLETDASSVARGRFLTQTDSDHNRTVAVLGMDVVERLFPYRDPVGETVLVDGHKFQVVGVLERKGSIFGESRDNLVIVPIGTFFKIWGKNRSIAISVQAASAELYQQAQEQVIGILRAARKVPPWEDNDFEIFSNETLVETFNNLTRYVRLAAYIIASISLIVAGVGIMNIMLVSVMERTREIGIRMAVGAKRRHILTQFLVEAVTLTEVGGAIGILLGILLAQLVRAVTPLPAVVPIWTLILGLFFCSLVGIVFGVYPATRAARLDPIEALRYE